jgi:hypothetical protein
MSGLFTRRKSPLSSKLPPTEGPTRDVRYAEARERSQTKRTGPSVTLPKDAPKKYQQKFWKTGKQLEKGRSYSMVGSRTGFLSQKTKYSLTPLGKFKGVNTKDTRSGTVRYDFERKNITVPLNEALKPTQKKFILNCMKGGYGTRRAASQVRRHTRRRVPQ